MVSQIQGLGLDPFDLPDVWIEITRHRFVAFKLYRKEVFEGMELLSTGALIDTEVLARATRKGCRIVQRPVQHYPRTAGDQTGAKISVILRAFRELFSLRKQILSQPKG